MAKEYSSKEFDKFIKQYIRNNNEKYIITTSAVTKAFDEYFTEDFQTCGEMHCYIWQELDERMAKHNFDYNEFTQDYDYKYENKPKKPFKPDKNQIKLDI